MPLFLYYIPFIYIQSLIWAHKSIRSLKNITITKAISVTGEKMSSSVDQLVLLGD